MGAVSVKALAHNPALVDPRSIVGSSVPYWPVLRPVVIAVNGASDNDVSIELAKNNPCLQIVIQDQKEHINVCLVYTTEAYSLTSLLGIRVSESAVMTSTTCI